MELELINRLKNIFTTDDFKQNINMYTSVLKYDFKPGTIICGPMCIEDFESESVKSIPDYYSINPDDLINWKTDGKCTNVIPFIKLLIFALENSNIDLIRKYEKYIVSDLIHFARSVDIIKLIFDLDIISLELYLDFLCSSQLSRITKINDEYHTLITDNFISYITDISIEKNLSLDNYFIFLLGSSFIDQCLKITRYYESIGKTINPTKLDGDIVSDLERFHENNVPDVYKNFDNLEIDELCNHLINHSSLLKLFGSDFLNKYFMKINPKLTLRIFEYLLSYDLRFEIPPYLSYTSSYVDLIDFIIDHLDFFTEKKLNSSYYSYNHNIQCVIRIIMRKALDSNNFKLIDDLFSKIDMSEESYSEWSLCIFIHELDSLENIYIDTNIGINYIRNFFEIYFQYTDKISIPYTYFFTVDQGGTCVHILLLKYMLENCLINIKDDEKIIEFAYFRTEVLSLLYENILIRNININIDPRYIGIAHNTNIFKEIIDWYKFESAKYNVDLEKIVKDLLPHIDTDEARLKIVLETFPEYCEDYLKKN